MTTSGLRIQRADERHLLALAPLFAAYRRFYYPSFASVALGRMFVLYDLFVAPQARRCGAGAALLRAAVHYASEQGASELMLQTATGNAAAQRLYEREGWTRDEEFLVYNYRLAPPAASEPRG